MASDVDRRNGTVQVVIVDSDWRVRRDLSGFLGIRPGIRVAGVAADLPSAMALVRERRPDVVVVDPHLPDLATGLAFVAWLKQTSSARIVALSNDASAELPSCATGADDFALKSGQTASLLEAIHRAAGLDLSARRARAARTGPPEKPATPSKHEATNEAQP